MAKLEYLNTVWSNFVSLTDCQKEIENKQVCNAVTLLINSNVQFFLNILISIVRYLETYTEMEDRKQKLIQNIN